MPGNALTAEHDFVIETAESAVAALLDSVVTMLPATLQLQRAEFGPDVEGQVNLLYRWPPGFGVRAVTSGWRPDRMIPDDLGLFQLTFLVYAGSLSLASPTGGRIAPLVGRLTVGPIAVQTATGEVQPPGADPDDPSAFVLVGLNASLSVVATVDLAWSDDTAARIETLLAGVQSLDRAGITALITDGIKKTLRPLAIPIVPQATPRRLRPGSYLTPTPRFTPYDGSLQSTPPLAVNFEPRSLAAANSRPGVLVNYVDILFHTFDVALHAQTQAGGFLRKTETATRTGYIGSVTIGPAAFSDLMLVPILPAALGVVPQGTTLTPEQASRFLPPALGTAESTALQQDFYLTQAAIRLAEGRIVLTGLVETGGTGYTAEASFSATMTLSLQQGVIVPNIRVDRVRVEIFIDWWVSFLAGLGLGPIGTAIEIAVRDHLEEEFSRLARSLFQSILDSALQPFNLPNTLVAYTPAVLEIHPEGVVIQYSGSLPARYQPPAVSLGLGVTTNVLDQTTGKTQTDRGALCTRDDYTYVETLQRDSR
jgi:hypothetical protein